LFAGALATRYHWSPEYRTTLSIFVLTPVCIALAAVFCPFMSNAIALQTAQVRSMTSA
jgi:hypothetical protein